MNESNSNQELQYSMGLVNTATAGQTYILFLHRSSLPSIHIISKRRSYTTVLATNFTTVVQYDSLLYYGSIESTRSSAKSPPGAF